MRPPTPRLRINSEDFLDNNNDNSQVTGPPFDSFLTISNHTQQQQQQALHSQTTNNHTTTTATTPLQQQQEHTNALNNFYFEDTLAALAAETDLQDISVL